MGIVLREYLLNGAYFPYEKSAQISSPGPRLKWTGNLALLLIIFLIKSEYVSESPDFRIP